MVSFFGLEFDLVSFGFLLAELFVLWLAFRVLDSVVHRKFSTRLKKSELFLARKVMRFAFGLAGVYAILVTFSVEPGDLVFSTTILAAAITLSAIASAVFLTQFTAARTFLFIKLKKDKNSPNLKRKQPF